MSEAGSDRHSLNRSVSARQLFTMAFGCIIGVGWVVYLGFWLEPSGPLGAALGFAGGTALVALIGMCYAEMAALYPVSGGAVVYVYDTFGTTVSFLTGWLLAFVYIAVTSWEAISLGLLSENLLPGIRGPELYVFASEPVHLGGLLLGLVLMGFFVWINLRGAQSAARVQEYLMYAFLLICAVFIGAGLLLGDVSNLRPYFVRSETGSVWPAIFATFVTAPYFLGGFDTIPQLMEEKSPGTPVRMAALMIVVSVLAAGAFYCVVILASSMVLPWTELVEIGELPSATAFELALGSPWLGRLVLVAALIGILTTWNAILLAASRIIFALSRAWMIPPAFSEVHSKFGSPGRAIFFVGALGALGVFLGRGGIAPIVNMASMGFGLVFGLVCVGVMVLRVRRPEAERPYRAPGGWPVLVLATLGAFSFVFFVVSDLLTVTGGFPLEFTVLLAGLGVGLLLWTVGARARGRMPEAERDRIILGGGG